MNNKTGRRADVAVEIQVEIHHLDVWADAGQHKKILSIEGVGEVRFSGETSTNYLVEIDKRYDIEVIAKKVAEALTNN